MRVYSHTTTYEFPWDRVTLAFWNKYTPQNPHVQHIKGYDLLSRGIDEQSGLLRSTRLILKKGKLPAWGQGFMKKPEALVLEDTEVDPKAKIFIARTQNINYTKIMSVIEVMQITVHPDNDQWTQMVSTAHVVSNVGWGLEGKLEQFGMHRFVSGAVKSSEAMKFAVERLAQNLNFKYQSPH